MDCQEAQELLAAYALGSLPEEEGSLLLDHVRGCVACQGILLEDHEVLARLALMEPTQLATPPPDLFDRILESIGTQESAPRREGRPGSVPLGSPFSWRSLVPRPITALAVTPLILLLAALAAGVFLLAARVGQAERDAQALVLQTESQRELLRLAAAPGAARLDLSGTGEAPRAWGRLIFEPAKEEAAFLAMNLPPSPAGRVYQLWLVWGDQRADGGTFTVSPDGRVEVLVKAPWAMEKCEAAGVTLEPLGGSKEPTGPRMLRGERDGAPQGW
ncbi:MAG: anti-sigma factor [Chloroflexi bacterium]|nr:anti-sigma factor [Chloroflexota bacterium]